MVVVALLLLGGRVEAQQGAILRQDRNASGEGYTVLRVWGTPHEMGYAQGFLLANEAVTIWTEVKAKLGALYGTARGAMAASVWRPADLEDEMQGMIEGIKAAKPGTVIDLDDMKVVNTLGDWMYFACRSHSTWGSFVRAPTRTLSTRRLDFSTPTPSFKHHVLVARAPSNGGVRWVNLGWAGMVTAVTGVNEHGTVASLHDYQSQMAVGSHMPRMVAVRYVLTVVAGLPVEQHLDKVYSELQAQSAMTSGFINYYVPEGKGGVITCPKGAPCTKKRLPQAAFLGGEVLLTTNQETDGLSAPSDDSFMAAYYEQGGTKTIADHYALMGHGGLHLLSVDYRGRNDMTLWAEGRTSSGVTPTIKVEWTELFQAAPLAREAGSPADGAARLDAATRPEAATLHGEADAQPQSSGCGCTLSSRAGGADLATLLAALALAVAVVLRRR